MSTLDWWSAPEPRLVRVWVKCEYDDGQEPSQVSFVADPSLGVTAPEVSAEIRRRVAMLEEFELLAVGEAPIPFASETVKRIAVW